MQRRTRGMAHGEAWKGQLGSLPDSCVVPSCNRCVVPTPWRQTERTFCQRVGFLLLITQSLNRRSVSRSHDSDSSVRIAHALYH